MAGTRPSWRRRRAAPLPAACRGLAARVCMVVAVMGAGYLAPPRGSRNSGVPPNDAGPRQAKRELTLSELWIRLMASPRRRAIDTCLIFGQALAASESGIVSLTITSARGDSAMRLTAGPENTPC